MRPLIPALLLASTPVFADVTPQDVIEDWRAIFTAYGGNFTTDTPEITGDTTRFGQVTADMGIMDMESKYRFEWFDLKDNGDGTLTLTISPFGEATTLSTLPDGNSIEAVASYDLASLTVHISGTPDEIVYAYSAPVITVTQRQSMPEGTMSMSLAMEGLAGGSTTLHNAAGAQITVDAEMTANSMLAEFTFKRTGSGKFALTYQASDYSVPYVYSLSTDPGSAQSGFPFPHGMTIDASMSTGAAEINADWQMPEGSGSFTYNESANRLDIVYDGASLGYGIVSQNGALTVTTSLPEIALAFDSFAFDLAFPTRKSERPLPFGFAFALTNLTLGDEVWALFDPEATLSRDPASFEISLNGTAQLFTDLFDRSAMLALRSAPFELRSLSLSSLNLNVEGMGLDGAGDITFNGARIDPSTGMPEPTGVLDFSITGALGLFDKLGRLGMIEPMVIIGAKGALGMFASPASGPDSFTSSVEFLEGGNITINGQPVN